MDIKNITIGVLALAFIIVSVLYVQEKNRPDALTAIKTACTDVSTEERLNLCVSSVQEVRDILNTIGEGQ